MLTDRKGCSTCPKGQEHWEHFTANKKRYVQYEYRTESGSLFTCVAANLDAARQKRDTWKHQQQGGIKCQEAENESAQA